MRVALRIIIGLLLSIAVLLAVGFLLPRKYSVERSVEIAAPPAKIFPFIEDPREWTKWTVWHQRDPQMKLTYRGPEKGQGAGWSWDSKTEGKGSMEFTRIEAPRLLEYSLTFPEFNMSSTGKLELTPAGSNTRVSWTNAGDLGGNPISRYFGLVMDSMVGKDFRAGLENLKSLAEK
jgi:uncharacterized protein YndB with AHSA1/START domain